MTTFEFAYETAEKLGYPERDCMKIANQADSYPLEPLECNQKQAFRVAIYDLMCAEELRS